MKITFYVNNADRRVVDKSKNLIQIVEYNNCTFKDSQSVVNPSIIIQSSDKSLFNKINYCYIDALNTYYYITDVVIESGNRYVIQLEEDVLHTYRDSIKELTAVISRQEFKYDQYLDDPKYRVENYKRVQTFYFPDGLTNQTPSFVLAVAGGDFSG